MKIKAMFGPFQNSKEEIMSKWIKGALLVGCLMVMGILFSGITGCSGLSESGGFGFSSGPSTPISPLYYEGFNDVLVPGELEAEKKKFFVFQSHGFSAGILAFKGRVERGSLIAFFKENMVKDGWRSLGSILAARSIQLFQKQNRWCVIGITDGTLSTEVEISVVPGMEVSVGESLPVPPPAVPKS
jgi:hypothetical protein